MSAKLIWEQDGAQEILLKFSDIDLAALKNDLPGDDGVKDWFKSGPAAQKAEKCKKRLIKEWQPRLFDDPKVDSIPATQDGLIAEVLKRPDYKDRAARDAEEAANRKK